MSIPASLQCTILTIVLYLAQTTTPAVFLISSRKTSPLRHLCVPIQTCILYQYLSMKTYCAGPGCYGLAGGFMFLTILQAINLLHIAAVDKADLVSHKILDSTCSFPSALFTALTLFFSLRGVNTPWQVKHMAPFPRWYQTQTQDKGKCRIRRNSFLKRQFAIITWQCLAMNVHFAFTAEVMDSLQLQPYQPHLNVRYIIASPREWSIRMFIMVFFFFGRMRLVSDLFYRVMSLFAVVMGYSRPEDWPPLYGSAQEAYTIRRFWNNFWHQLLYRSLNPVSSVVAGNILQLPQSSTVYFYTKVFIAFLLSGIFHVLGDMALGVPTTQSGAIPYFLSAALGVVVEDMVFSIWRRLFGNADEQTITIICKRGLGYVWVLCWQAATIQWWFYPIKDVAKIEIPEPSIPELLGMHTALGVVGAGGLLLRVFLGVEI